MADAHTRMIPAPAQEWLSKRELCNALDMSERAVDTMIKAGRFPRGTPWDGKELRWRWWVVVWYSLSKDVQPLLGELPPDQESGDEKPAPANDRK